MFSERRVRIIDLVNQHEVEEVRRLINEKKCNLDERDGLGRSAVLFAAMYNNVSMLELLIQGGASVNIEEDDAGRTPFSVAEDFPEILKLLNKAMQEQKKPPQGPEGGL